MDKFVGDDDDGDDDDDDDDDDAVYVICLSPDGVWALQVQKLTRKGMANLRGKKHIWNHLKTYAVSLKRMFLRKNGCNNTWQNIIRSSIAGFFKSFQIPRVSAATWVLSVYPFLTSSQAKRLIPTVRPAPRWA